MLIHVANVLTADELAHVRARLASAQWTDGRESVGSLGATVKHNLQVQESDPIRAELGTLILAAIRRHAVFHSAALPQRILMPRFNCYQDGGNYGFHVDGSVMRVDADTQLRSDLSCTLFLNEPSAYEGGELVIRDTYGDHEVKLPAGDLILYPSSSLHQVLPVHSGQRLAAFTWVQSLVRSDVHRRLLLELDTSIQQLRNAKADASAIVQLTGVYHNLLREWAET